MKDSLPNILSLIVGAILIFLEIAILRLNGTGGWLLISAGVVLMGIGFFYKTGNPIKTLVRLFINFF